MDTADLVVGLFAVGMGVSFVSTDPFLVFGVSRQILREKTFLVNEPPDQKWPHRGDRGKSRRSLLPYQRVCFIDADLPPLRCFDDLFIRTSADLAQAGDPSPRGENHGSG